jgi:hypothetical protein
MKLTGNKWLLAPWLLNDKKESYYKIQKGQERKSEEDSLKRFNGSNTISKKILRLKDLTAEPKHP